MVKKNKINVIKIEQNDAQVLDKKLPHLNGIVLFHHPGCIHCIMLKPKWDMMKEKAMHTNGKIMEVSAEALEQSHHPIKHQINGFPMIVYLNNGHIKDTFAEERNVENMLRFVTKHLHHTKNKLDYNYKFKNSKKHNIVKVKKTKTRNTKKKS
jgi:hypothetical protein